MFKFKRNMHKFIFECPELKSDSMITEKFSFNARTESIARNHFENKLHKMGMLWSQIIKANIKLVSVIPARG